MASRRAGGPGAPDHAGGHPRRGRVWEEILAEHVDLGAIGRYGERGEVRHYQMSRGDLAHLAEQQSVLVSGVAGAVGHGELLSPDGSEPVFYLADSMVDQLLSMVAAVPAPLWVWERRGAR